MAKKMEIDQFDEFTAAVVQSLPRDMDTTMGQGWITNRDALAKVLRKALMPPEEEQLMPPEEEELMPPEAEQVSSVTKQFPSAALAKKHGYEVLEDAEQPTDFHVRDLEFISFLKDKEKSIDGDELRTRAVTLKGNFALCDAARFLEEQADISTELLGTMDIVLAATKLRYYDGSLRMAYLGRDDSRWVLNFRWLGDNWSGGARLPRSK